MNAKMSTGILSIQWGSLLKKKKGKRCGCVGSKVKEYINHKTKQNLQDGFKSIDSIKSNSCCQILHALIHLGPALPKSRTRKGEERIACITNCCTSQISFKIIEHELSWLIYWSLIKNSKRNMGQVMWMAETRLVQGGLHVCARGGCSDEQAIGSHEQDCGK